MRFLIDNAVSPTVAEELDGAGHDAVHVGKDGWWTAQVIEIPEALSQVRTLDEARENVADALALALDLHRDEGKEIPSPGRVAVAPVAPVR